MQTQSTTSSGDMQRETQSDYTAAYERAAPSSLLHIHRVDVTLRIK